MCLWFLKLVQLSKEGIFFTSDVNTIKEKLQNISQILFLSDSFPSNS